MRIDRFDLIAFGSFTDRSLDLSSGEAGLHLIYGDNEAGKSTSLRALIALFFGIEPRTSDNYLHSNPQLRIGGILRLSTGGELDFIRRKGSKGTLLERETGKTIDDAVLNPYLPGGIDEHLFTTLYGIDHSRLISGGKELLNQSGDLGQALFSAAVGTSNLRNILSGLQAEAEELYKPRASTKIVNQAISGFKESIRQSKDSSLSVTEWKRLQKELSECLGKIQTIEGEIKEKSRDKSKLDRLNRVKGALAERENVKARIEEMGQVLMLPEDFNETYKIVSRNLHDAREAEKRAEAKRVLLIEESECLDVRHELLDNEEEILRIYKELGAIETAIKDRPQQDGKRRLLRNEAMQLLKTIAPDASLDGVDELRPLTNNKKWISGLAGDHSLLIQNKNNVTTSLRDVEDEYKITKQELKELAVSPLDLSELKAVVVSARKTGDLEKRLSDSQKRVLEKESACEVELSRLGKFSGTINTLAQLSLPVTETLDLFEKRLDALDEETKNNNRKKNELAEEKRQTEQNLAKLLLAGDVPTISELEKARFERGHGWNLIRQKYIEKRDVENDISVYIDGSDLTVVYENKVNTADQVSDQLRLDADRVVKRADYEAKIDSLRTCVIGLNEEIDAIEKNKEVCQKEWTSVWTPLGIIPGTPREMKQWLLKAEMLLVNAGEAQTISQDSKVLAAELNTVKKNISQQIVKIDNSIDHKEMSLEAMICFCEQRVEQEEKVREQKRNLEASLNRIEIRIKRAQEELKKVEKEFSVWSQEWSKAIEGLGLGRDAHPEQALGVLEQLAAFFETFDKSEELRRRIFGIDKVISDFDENVKRFVDDIGFQVGEEKATNIAVQLHKSLNMTREAKASQTKIDTQIKETSDEIVKAGISIQTAKEQIAALIQQAGVEREDDLERAGEKSKSWRELGNRLESLEQELTRNGDGLTIQELKQEADSSDIDSLNSTLEKISDDLKDLHDTRDQLRDDRQTIQSEIKTKDGSAEAANAAEEAQQQLTIIVSGIEQYSRLQIASLILEKRIEDYRKKNQAPILARAGEIFSKLTLGLYSGLRDELDKNSKPILLGIRSNNDEVEIDGMSDGTRDQLYLSLRLSTLEQHIANSEPMPFIVDDILIGFDDDRTKACLEVLAELALRTQVLVFTHHRRVLELACDINSKAGVFPHELS